MEAKEEEYTDDVFELEGVSPMKSGGGGALLSPAGFEESESITLPSPPPSKVVAPEGELVPLPPPSVLSSDQPVVFSVDESVAAPRSDAPGVSSELGVGVGVVEGGEESKVPEETPPLPTLPSSVPATVPAQPSEGSSDGKEAEGGDSITPVGPGPSPSASGGGEGPLLLSTPPLAATARPPTPPLVDSQPAASSLPPPPVSLPSPPAPSLPSGLLTVSGLAGALFSQFGAPPKAQLEDGIKGWLDDTPTTGLLHLSLGDVMKRLCSGRPPLTRTTLEGSLSVFLAVCTESASRDGGATALEGCSQRIARCPLSLSHLPLIRLGVGETEASAARLLTLEEGGEDREGKSDDDSPSGGLAWVEYLATVGHLIPGLEGVPAAGEAPPQPRPPASASTGEVGALPSSAPSTHSRLLSIASHLFRASSSKDALGGLHCALEATADAVTTGAGVGERRLARASLDPLLRLPHGEELLKGVGWEIEGRDDPRGCLYLAKCGEEEEEGRTKLSSLVASLGELESHVTLIEGATPLSSLVRLTLTSKVINVDDQSMVEWLGKVLTAVRVVSHFTKVVVTSPHDPLLWRVPCTHPLFVAHCVKPFGEGVAWALLECGGFLHSGDAGVLKGSEGLNPAQCLAPLSLPTSPPPSQQGVSEGGEGGGEEEEEDSLAPKLSSDTVDFALRRHEACEREAARLVRWYKKAARGGDGDMAAVQLPNDPCLPPPNPPPATIPILPGVLPPTGGAAGGVGGSAPTAAGVPPPPTTATTTTTIAKKPAGKGGKGAGAPVGPPPNPLLSLELPPPGSEGSLVMAVLLKGGALNEDSGAAVFAEDAGGGGAGGAAGGGKKAPPAKKGGAAVVAHAPTYAELAIKVVEVTHPKFALQCAQLRHLRGSYLRLDKKSLGCAYRSDIASAFAAEIRPLEERTDEYLDLWIRSRDLNRDGAVSWAEYAASFAPLFLPPGTGCDEVSVREEGEKLAASAMAAATAAASGAAGGGKGKASASKASSAAAPPSDNLFIRDFQADQVAYEKALGVAGQVCSARRWVARELRVLAFAAMGQLEATVAGGHHLGAGSATANALESAKAGGVPIFTGATPAPTAPTAPSEGQSSTVGGLVPTLPGREASSPPTPTPTPIHHPHMSPGTFLSMPTAPGAIDTLCGLGLLHLFAGRSQARQLLRGITSHITSLVASPGDSRLWALKVVGGVKWGLEASPLTSGITRSTDCSIASEVVALPGVALLLRGVGFKGVVGKGGKGTIEEFRLPVVLPSSTPSSPLKASLRPAPGKQGSPHLSRDTLDGLIMAATVLARHAVVYEASEACDPAAVLMGVMALVTGSPPSSSGDTPGGGKCLATLFREILNAPPPPSPSSASGSAAPPKGKAPAKGKGVVASGPPPISDPVALSGSPTVGEASLDMDMAKRWCVGLEQLDKYLKVGERKVDTLTPTFQKFLTALPAGGVSTLHVVHPEDPSSASASTASLESCWPGVKFFTALGYREDPSNGHLVLPPPPHHLVVAAAAAGGGKGGEKSHSIIPPELTSRHLEVSSALHFLKAIVHLSHKLHLWKDVKLPAMALKKAAEGRGGGVGGGGDGPALFSRVPTSLLTAVLDPRTALEKRYMESSSLRGGDATTLGGAGGGGDIASSSLLLLDTSSASSLGGGGGGGRPPLSAPPSLNSSFTSGGSGGGGMAPPPHSAGALASLGPEEGAVALSRVMEEKEKLREAAASKISALESEVKELRATVRSHNVDELVPKLKASLVTLGKAEGGEEVKRSAVQAAMGLGLPSSVSGGGAGDASPHPAGKTATPRSGSVDKSKKDPKKALASNSARAALVSKDVVTHSSIRTSAFTPPGSTQLLLRFIPEDMTIDQQAALSEEEVAMVQRGASVIPSPCRLKGGDWILVGAQSVTGFYAFVKRVKFGGMTADLAGKDIIYDICGEVIEEEEAEVWGEEGLSSAIAGDECMVLLDRPVPQDALPEDTFITATHPDAESLKAFYRHELFSYLSNTLLPDIVNRAAQLGEVSVLAREAEAGYIHRTVTKHIPTVVKLWGEEVSSPIPSLFAPPSASLTPDLSASGRLPAADNLTNGARGFPLLCSVGGSFFLSSDFASVAAVSQGDSPYPSLLPAKALVTPFSPLGGGGDVATHPHAFASPFSYAFDALDFGGAGALSLDAIVSRASQVPSVWSLLNSHAPLPVAPLTVLPSGASYAAANPTHTVGKGVLGAPTSTPASIWRSLCSYQSQGAHGELVVPRALFASLFRPLHDLDWVVSNSPHSSSIFHFLSTVHPSAALGLTPIPSTNALPGLEFVRGEGDDATSIPGRVATASAFASLSSHESLHPDAVLASMSTGSALVMEAGVTSEVVFSAYGPVEDLGDDDEEEDLIGEGEGLEMVGGDEMGATFSHSSLSFGDGDSSSLSALPLSPRKRRALQAQSRALRKAALAPPPPPLRQNISIQGAMALCLALDGDAPSLGEVLAALKRYAVEGSGAGFVAAALGGGGGTESVPSATSSTAPGTPLALGSISLPSLYHFRCARDATLLSLSPATLATLPLSSQLAVARRALYPTPGTARLQVVEEGLRGAFVVVREREFTSGVRVEESGGWGGSDEVKDRVWSVSVGDITRCLGETDAGRRVLSFPLGPCLSTTGGSYNPMEGFTVAHLLESLGRMSVHGHVSWSTLSSALHSGGRLSCPLGVGDAAGGGTSFTRPLLPPLTSMAASSLQATLPDPTLFSSPPQGMTGFSAHAPPLVLDILPVPAASSIAVLTSDGVLTSWCTHTLTRRWSTPALPPAAAAAFALTRSRVTPVHGGGGGKESFLVSSGASLRMRLLSTGISAPPPPSHFEEPGPGVSPTTQSHAVILLNACPVGVAWESEANGAGSNAAMARTSREAWLAEDPLHSLNELLWFSDSPSNGTLVARCSPRFIGDAPLPPDALFPLGGGQEALLVPSGTCPVLLETLYLADAHLVFALAVLPGHHADHEDGREWPRVLALCGLTGAVVGDLGVLHPRIRDAWGCHLTYNPTSRHLLVADATPTGAPILRVYDVSPLFSALSRSRSAFMGAAGDPGSAGGGVAAAATASLSSSFALNESSAASLSFLVGEVDPLVVAPQQAGRGPQSPSPLFPRVLPLPPSALLDLSCPFTPSVPFNAAMPPTSSLCLLETTGMLAVAGWDGRVSLWDTTHVRHRLLYPPSSPPAPLHLNLELPFGRSGVNVCGVTLDAATDTLGDLKHAAAKAWCEAQQGEDGGRVVSFAPPFTLFSRTRGVELAPYPDTTPLRSLVDQGDSVVIEMLGSSGISASRGNSSPTPTPPPSLVDQDSGWTAVPTGCHIVSTLPLCTYYKPAGVLNSASGRLSRPAHSGLGGGGGEKGGYHTSPVSFSAVGLASICLTPQGLCSRPPSRIQTPESALRAAEIISHSLLGGLHHKSGEDTVKEHSPRSGYIYLLDDGTVLSAEPPSSSPTFDPRWVTLDDDALFLTMASSSGGETGSGGEEVTPAAVDTLRRVSLARDKLVRVFYVVSKQGIPCASLLPAVARTFVLPSGAGGGAAPLSMPTAGCPMRVVLKEIAAAHDSACGGSGDTMGAMNAMESLSTLCSSPASHSRTPLTPDKLASALSSSTPLTLVPFFTPGDSSGTLAPLVASLSSAAPSSHPSLGAPHVNPGAYAFDGGYWTTGVVVEAKPSLTTAVVTVALEGEERRVAVCWDSVQVLKRSQGSVVGLNLGLGSVTQRTSPPYPGDVVALRVQSASAVVESGAEELGSGVAAAPSLVSTSLGPAHGAWYPPYGNLTPLLSNAGLVDGGGRQHPFNPLYSGMSGTAAPPMDILALALDWGSPGSMHRRLELWGVGRGSIVCPVHEYDKDEGVFSGGGEGSDVLAREDALQLYGAVDGAFQGAIPGYFLGGCAGWIGANAVGLRRQIWRERGTIGDARELYSRAAASSLASGGVNATAWALLNTIQSSSAREEASRLPALRHTLGYLWALSADMDRRGVFKAWALTQEEGRVLAVTSHLRAIAMEGGGGEEGGEDLDSAHASLPSPLSLQGSSSEGLPLSPLLSVILTAAWHFPLLRYHLRYLFSLPAPSSAPPSSFTPPSVLHIPTTAAAAMPALSRLLSQGRGRDAGGDSLEGGGDEASNPFRRISLDTLLAAATTVASKAPLLESLLPTLGYLRAGVGSNGVPVTEHMVDALIRRRVLPWDPPTLLSLGVGDPATVTALCLAAPVAQPLESHTTGEIVFLLADAPTVSSVNLPGLSALASTFADPMSALRATMALLTSAADTLHYRLKARVHGAAPTTSAMLFASHSRFAGLVASAFSPSVTPTFAKSVKRAMAAKVAASEASVSLKALMEIKSATRLALYNRMNAKGAHFSPSLSQLPGSLGDTGGETPGEVSARRALARESLLLRARSLLKGSPKSVNLSTGRDESWVSAFVDCAAVFTASAAGYARESPRVWGGGGAVSASASPLPSPTANLTTLLSSGGLEALVSAAIIHTHLALSLPAIRSSGADVATPLSAVLGTIDALISVCERDSNPGAGRMAPHLPRLLRALVHAATGRLSGISEDAEGVGEEGVGSSAAKGSLASEAGSSMAPLLQPAYVSLSVSIFTPVLRRLLGPTGSGAHTIPALRRYISNCGTVAALGRGVEAGAAAAVSHITMGGAGSLLTVLVDGPFLQPFSPYLTGLAKAARVEAQTSLTARNALEAGQQSLRRHFASASFQHTVKSFLDRYKGVAVGGRAKHPTTASSSSSREPLLLKMASQGSAQLTSPYSSFRRGPAFWGSLLSALTGIAALHEGCPDPIADATPKGGSAGMGSHVRLLERTASRRAAASRLASVLTPPLAFSSPCPLLAGLSSGGGSSGSGREEGGGSSEDVEVDDCDRALLAMDLSLPDFTAALMMDPDPVTRATAFKASRNLSLAVAWPGMVDWYRVGRLEEGGSEEDFHVETTPGMSRSMVHFSSAVRERAWGRLLLRFSSTDCVLAAVKVCLQHCSWAKGGPDTHVAKSGKTVNTALPPPDSPDTVASAIDLLAASVGGKTVLPCAWRAVGVSRALTRLVRLGFGKLRVAHPSSSSKSAGGGGQGSGALEPHFLPTSLLEALLARLVTDTVTNEYLTALFKHDGPTRTWGGEVGLLAVRDVPETWPQLVGTFQSALVTLEVCGVLDVVSTARGETGAPTLSSLQASMDGHHTLANYSWKGVGGQDRRSEMFGLENGGVRGEAKVKREGSMPSTSLAEKLAATLTTLLPLAPTLKRLLGIEIETLAQGFAAASMESASPKESGEEGEEEEEEGGGEDGEKSPLPSPYDTDLFNGGMGALWALGEAAWTLILSTHPNAHALRHPAYTFCHLLLSIVSWGASQGPLTAALTLGCPPDEPPTGAVWPGLAALVRWGGGCTHIAFRANTADGGAWRVSTRALGVLGEVLSGAVGVMGVEAVEEEVIGRVVQSAAIARAARAANEGGVVAGEGGGGGGKAGAPPPLHPMGSKVWLERGYALGILAQSCDAGVVEAHAQSCVATTELFEWAEAAKNVGLHCFTGKGGEAYATGVAARSLLWASICRCALLKPPPTASSPLPSSPHTTTTTTTTSQLPSVSAAFAAHIMHCDAPRYAVSRMLPCPILLTSGGSTFCPPSLLAYEDTYAPRCEGASLLTTLGALVTAAKAKSEADAQVDAAEGVVGGIALPPTHTTGTAPPQPPSLNTTTTTTSASGVGLTPWEGALKGLGPGEPTLSSPHPSHLAPLHSLSEYIVGVVVSEGVAGRERSRLWSVRDVAYAPTVPFVLQALLWCCPQAEALRGALSEMDTPTAAFEWVAALSRLWKAACVGRSTAAASTRASAKAASVEGGKPAMKFDHNNLGTGLTALRGEYMECEKAAGLAWARWRAYKLGLAPTAGEMELGKGFEGGSGAPSSTGSTTMGGMAGGGGTRGAHVSPPLLPLPRGGLGPGGGIPRAAEVALGTVHLLSTSTHRSLSTGRSTSVRLAAAPPLEAPSAPPLPPLPPTSPAPSSSMPPHSVSFKRATPLLAKNTAANTKASPARTGGKSLGGSFSLVPFGGLGGVGSAAAKKRAPPRESFTVSALAQGAPTLVPPPPPLEATNLALQVIGEGIVAVKALFYAQAAPCARGGEAAVASDTPTLKRLVSGLGIPPPEDHWFDTARRAHVLPGAPGAPLPFAPFLRFVSSVMVEQGMSNLGGEGGGGDSRGGGEFDFGEEGGGEEGGAPTPHFTAGGPSPFLASAVHRSTLPPIPHPGSEALSNAIGEAGGVIRTPQALSTALSYLGVPVTSEEIKEVYAMLSLHEKAVVDVDALTVCFKTLAGWKKAQA